MPRYRHATMSISLLALALAGCNKSAQDMSAATASPSPASLGPDSGLPALPAALPMQTGPAGQLTTAPPVAALPVRRYVNVGRPANDREAYAYLDRASDIEDEIGDAPPDYDYDNDDGVSPWVWQTGGGDYRYAEPVDGGYRYYYYQPGARYPYLVRTHDYSYAYAGAALVAVYALSGALVPPDRYGGYRDQASRYFSRGQQLRQASDQRRHQGVVAANWAARRAQFSAAQANWAADRARQSAWQAYHAQNDPSQQPGWQQEHQQRQQVSQQFSGWQSRGLAGSPPAALAAVGARAIVGAGPRRPDAGQPVAISRQPGSPAVPDGHRPGNFGQPGVAGPGPAHFHDANGQDRGGPQGGLSPVRQNPNSAAQATAAREQQLAAQNEARHQAQVSQRLEARAAQQQAAAQREAGAREQTARERIGADVRHQQDTAARQELAGRQRAQEREAQASAHQAQLHALAAQHQAETARVQEARVHTEGLGHDRPQLVPAARERAPELAPAARPEPRPPVQRPPEAQRPPEPRPPAPHPEAPHPEQAHPAPGHPSPPGRENEHHDR